MIESSIIDGIVKKYYDVSEVENTRYSMVFHIQGRGNEKTFGYLLDELDKVGATAFTNDFPDSQIIVINNGNVSRERRGLKTLMLFLSMAALIYTGSVYYSSYYSSDLIYRNIIYGTLFYAIPVISILLFREAGKYIALRKNHIKYNFPIFVPSPGLGTLGTINSNKNQFRDSKSMIEAGTFSLFFGFLASILLIIAGAAIMPYVNYSSAIHSPISVLNFPLVFPVALDHLFPAYIIPDPLELAGYVGIITTALNSMPVGFMDGGLVFSGILGKQFKYASYAGIAILLAASILYPYILILAVLSILLGIKGALPMNNFFKPRASVKWLALVIVVIVIILGFAPLPLHNTDSNNVAIPDSCYIMQQNNTGNVSVNITVQNHGVNISPLFSVTPGNFTVKGFTQNKADTIYTLELITYNHNYSGRKNFTITVDTGMSSVNKTVSVYFLKPDSNMHINKTMGPENLTVKEYKPFNITIFNNSNSTLNAQIIPIFNSTGLYMSLQNNLNAEINLNPHIPLGILQIYGGQNQTLTLVSYDPGNLKLIIMGQGGQAAIVNIHILPEPRPRTVSPPGIFPTINYTGYYEMQLGTIHPFYNF